jgi:hypothetical protein
MNSVTTQRSTNFDIPFSGKRKRKMKTEYKTKKTVFSQIGIALPWEIAGTVIGYRRFV